MQLLSSLPAQLRVTACATHYITRKTENENRLILQKQRLTQAVKSDEYDRKTLLVQLM